MTGWRVLAGAGAMVAMAGAAAAEGAVGAIAYAQAVEQSGGVGTGETIEAAIAAARAECVAGGARAQDCLITAACAPAQWSVDIFVQHQEGPHWHEMLCGIGDEAVIAGVVAALCDRAARPWLIECALVQVRDPAGMARMEN